MIYYKCVKCGASSLEMLNDGRRAVCAYCNSIMVLPTLDPEVFNRANQLRLDKQFDLAEMEFERIVGENPEDSESYWNLVLCRFGIEYVKDKDGTMVPTCNRMSYNSFIDDPDYNRALKYADGNSYRLYQDEAAKIERVLKRIVNIAQSQPPCDIFISYKETDICGQRTEDSVIAQDVYDALKEKHPDLNIFLSRITLAQQAAGLEYEPIIFSALNTAKVMILVGTSAEYLDSTWVRNEWSRYRRMMDSDREKNMAILYKGISPMDFPKEIRSYKIQAAEAIGFYMQDFITSIENLLGIKKKATQYDYIQLQATSNRQINNLLKRAEQSLDDDGARTYYQKVLDIDAKCAPAWWGLFKLDTHHLGGIDETIPFTLSKEAENDWKMVQEYAKDEEKTDYLAQYTKYKDNWTNLYNEYTRKKAEEEEERRRAENSQKIDSEMENIIKESNDGLRFENYAEIKATLKSLYSLADSQQLLRLSQWESKFDKNYQKFLELQKLKATDPLDAANHLAEVQPLHQRVLALGPKKKATKKRLTGVYLVNVIVPIIAIVLTLIAHTNVLIRYTYHIIPLVFSVTLWMVIIGIPRSLFSKEAKAIEVDDAIASDIMNIFFAAIPAIITYFFLEYRIYIAAKEFNSELSWLCILSGIAYLLAIAGLIGLVVLFFKNFIAAIIVLVVTYVVVSAGTFLSKIQIISDSILREIMPSFFNGIIIALIVATLIRVLLYIAQKIFIVRYNQNLNEFNKAYSKYSEAVNKALESVRAPFRGYVDEKYLKNMSTQDDLSKKDNDQKSESSELLDDYE